MSISEVHKLRKENEEMSNLLKHHKSYIDLMEKRFNKMKKGSEDLNLFKAKILDLESKLKESNDQNDRWFAAYHSAISMAFYYQTNYPNEKVASNWIEDHCKKYYSEMKGKRI